MTREIPDTTKMMELMERLWPLHRTLVCDDMDRSMEIIGEYLPAGHEYKINAYPSGQKVWTWTVPEAYVVDEAYLEYLGENGPERIVDFADNPLHIVSYGPAFEGELSWDELEPHLFTNPGRPDALPWVFKFYDRDWGFCLPHAQFEALDRDGRYRAVMRTRFEPGALKVGEFTIAGESDDYFVLLCNVCHPNQVNDSISGLVVAVDFARRLAKRIEGGAVPRLSAKILFMPETIGSISYLANNESMIDRFKFAVFAEFIGHSDRLRMQRTRQDDHLLDRVFRAALQAETDGDFVEGAFCSTIITNDEKVTNAPGVDIPTVAINRWPGDNSDSTVIWPLYHTSDDCPSAIDPGSLAEVGRVYDAVFESLDSSYYPRRTFRGPLFLSGLDWDFDWKSDRRIKQATQNILLHLEGDRSSLDIAEAVGLDFPTVHRILEEMRRLELIEISDKPWSECA